VRPHRVGLLPHPRIARGPSSVHETAMSTLTFALRAATLLAAFAGSAGAARANCGAEMCNLIQDPLVAPEPRRWSLDLRIERILQDRLRAGSRSIDASELSDVETIERSTRTTALIGTLGYRFDAHWRASLRLPVLRRSHAHDVLDESTGTIVGSEFWRYSKLGDAELRADWLPAGDDGAALRWIGGLKLPTGSTQVTNADGVRAERTLQPGSGTTDAIVGVGWQRALGAADRLQFEATWTAALAAHDEFRPGNRLRVNVGWTHRLAASPWGTILQLNAERRGRDRGEQAEPDETGGSSLRVSPGVTLAVSPQAVVYLLGQFPLVQWVRGAQLTPRAALVFGYSRTL
jgi:hypothetical protein